LSSRIGLNEKGLGKGLGNKKAPSPGALTKEYGLKKHSTRAKKEAPRHGSIHSRKCLLDKKTGGKIYAGSTRTRKKRTGFLNIRRYLCNKQLLVGEMPVVTQLFQELNKHFLTIHTTAVIKHVQLLYNTRTRALEGRPAADITQPVTRFFVPVRTHKINSGRKDNNVFFFEVRGTVSEPAAARVPLFNLA
jgi:hypothetical protein